MFNSARTLDLECEHLRRIRSCSCDCLEGSGFFSNWLSREFHRDCKAGRAKVQAKARHSWPDGALPGSLLGWHEGSQYRARAGAKGLELLDGFEHALAVHFGDELGEVDTAGRYHGAAHLLFVQVFAREGTLHGVGLREVVAEGENNRQGALAQAQVGLALRLVSAPGIFSDRGSAAGRLACR